MGDAYVREVGRLKRDDRFVAVSVGVDFETVRIKVGGSDALLSLPEAEEFGRLFVSACWQAGQNAGSMAGEVPGG